MKKYISSIIFGSFLCLAAYSQDNMAPAPAYKGMLIIKNGRVHVGNGQVLDKTSIQVNNGKIEKLGVDLPVPSDVKVFDATGKDVYPGLILSNTNIGLREIGSQVKGSNDYNEIGDLNPNIRSIVAYNTDSKIINTLRSNGILFANVAPQGSLIAGSSSVVQFDAWTWEDAVYKADDGMHFYMPSLLARPNRFRVPGAPESDQVKEALDRIETVKAFFREAKVYNAQTAARGAINLKMEATKNLFSQKQRLFIHCNTVKEMLVAIDFVKEFRFNVTLIGASESYQVASLLKKNNISVILQQLFSLPTSDDDDVDQPFKTPAVLQKEGVLFALTDEDGQTTGRNLMFNAGTAASYGLTKEEALQSITLNAAKILGIDDRTGSIEVGKEANIIISNGDILDMRTSVVTAAFIQGRTIDLNDKHKQLNEKYKAKYGIR